MQLPISMTWDRVVRTAREDQDAKCSVCNSGDYEEEDLIVFCDNCNLPVHQSCYGIELIPEESWICYPCRVYGHSNIKCWLCPQLGGALKPSNVILTENGLFPVEAPDLKKLKK
jgi:hypothetical protein